MGTSRCFLAVLGGALLGGLGGLEVGPMLSLMVIGCLELYRQPPCRVFHPSGETYVISARTFAILGWILVLLGVVLSAWGQKDIGTFAWGTGVSLQLFAGYVHFFHGPPPNPPKTKDTRGISYM